MSALRRLLPLLELSRWRVLRAVLLGAAALGCSVALAATSAWLITRASEMPPVLTLSVAVVMVRAFGVGRGVLRYVERLASHDVALGGMAALRANLYDALATGSATGTARMFSLRRGELLGRVGSDVDDVGDFVVRSVIPAGIALLVGLASTVLIGWFVPLAGVALLLCLLLAGVVAPWLAARSAEVAESRGADARSEVAARTLALLEDGQQMRVAGRFESEIAALRSADTRLTAAGSLSARIAGTSAALGTAAQVLAVIAALWFGALAYLSGGIAAVEFAIVVLAPLAVFEVTSTLSAAAVQWRRSSQAAERLVALLPAQDSRALEKLGDESRAKPIGEVAGPLLQLEDVAVGWPSSPEPLLRNVTLRAQPGQLTAIVGPSGVGKTTLLMTAARLLPSLAGTVAQTSSTKSVFVAEDEHIFATSVLENLRVARGDVTEAEARSALTAVALDEWLAALPRGLDTELQTDAGSISGGERRRLLIARALLAEADVLLVDEPAEHLDDEHADAVIAALRDYATANEAAVVLATHRAADAAAAEAVVDLATPHNPA